MPPCPEPERRRHVGRSQLVRPSITMNYRNLGSDEVTLRSYRPVGQPEGQYVTQRPAAGVSLTFTGLLLCSYARGSRRRPRQHMTHPRAKAILGVEPAPLPSGRASNDLEDVTPRVLSLWSARDPYGAGGRCSLIP
jgi:hypothetical protein